MRRSGVAQKMKEQTIVAVAGPMGRRWRWVAGLALAGFLSICVSRTGICAQPAEDDGMLAMTKKMCESYAAGFLYPGTDLMYSRRIDTARGIGVFESPDQIAKEQVRGQYRPYGYGAGIEDVALQNGYLIFALCDAHAATGDAYLAELARRIFNGLKRLGTLSPVPGFVPRGPHPDGKSYYRDSSLDQHSLFVCGLWRYYHSEIADDQEKAFIRDALDKFARRMERNKWTLMVEDDSRVAHVGWCWLGMTPLNAEIMLSMVGAVQDVTGDPHWEAEYERFSDEKGGKRWKAIGAALRDKLPRYTLFYNQGAFRLATLARLEQDPDRKAIVVDRLRREAKDMLKCNFFTHWRRLDWIGERPDEEVNAYLAPIGLTTKSQATVSDLWSKFDAKLRSPKLPSDGRRRWYMAICARTPMIVWQATALSGDRELIRQVAPCVQQIPGKVDIRHAWSGWMCNDAIVATLLTMAAQHGK